MNVVSAQQWSGWFASYGSSGPMLQNLLTTIISLIFGGVAIFCVFKLIHLGVAKSNAQTAEERHEINKKLRDFGIGLVIAIILPTVGLTLMQTIGKTVQVTTTTNDPTTTTNPDLILNVIYTLKNWTNTIDFPKVL